MRTDHIMFFMCLRLNSKLREAERELVKTRDSIHIVEVKSTTTTSIALRIYTYFTLILI